MLMPEKYMLIDFNNFKPIRFMSALVLPPYAPLASISGERLPLSACFWQAR